MSLQLPLMLFRSLFRTALGKGRLTGRLESGWEETSRVCPLLPERWLEGRYDEEEQALGPVEEDVRAVLKAFRAELRSGELPRSMQKAFDLLAALRKWLGWDDGLREVLIDLAMGAVRQAERFGPKQGALKRQFAIAVVLRAMGGYSNVLKLPIAERFLAPVAGVLLDMTVTIFNEHEAAWTPVQRVRLPWFIPGRMMRLAAFAGWMWGGLQWLGRLLVRPSSYERNLQSAVRTLKDEVLLLQSQLPPERLGEVVDELASTAAQLGQLLAPHIKTLLALLKLAERYFSGNASRRRQVVQVAMRELLWEIYGRNSLAGHLLGSPLGDFLLSEVVWGMDHILDRLGRRAPSEEKDSRSLPAPAPLRDTGTG